MSVLSLEENILEKVLVTQKQICFAILYKPRDRLKWFYRFSKGFSGQSSFKYESEF